jgi:mono/diheme cytochrome c family protein
VQPLARGTTFAAVIAAAPALVQVLTTPRRSRGRAVTLAAILALALAACERPPSAESLREWTPADHRSTDDDKVATGARQAAATKPNRANAPPGQTGVGAPETAQLVELTWRQQCSTCHGPVGKGDGQMGPMLRVPDLTREAWQAAVSDAEIAATIKNGKGKMPNFDVPAGVLEGLVARVRAARGQ